MPVEIEEIGDEGLGDLGQVRYAQAALDAAAAAIEADPDLARWLEPLVRAIRRKRLRLPSLSPTVNRVLRLVDAPEVDLEELADAVNGDPVLATRIMGVANSSFFRGVSNVPNVRNALMRMGLREARTIVVVVALRSLMLRSPGLGQRANQLHRHALQTACVAQELAREVPPWEESAGFLAGLLHDLGQLVVLAFVAELPAWQEDGAEPDEATVEVLLAALHPSLGAMVLDSWGFPDGLCEAVLGHHEPIPEEAEDAAPLTRILQLADLMAHRIEAGWPDELSRLEEELLVRAKELGLSIPALDDVAAEAAASAEALSKLG